MTQNIQKWEIYNASIISELKITVCGGQLMCVLAMVINAFRCLGVRFDDFAFLRLNWSRHSGVKSGVK